MRSGTEFVLLELPFKHLGLELPFDMVLVELSFEISACIYLLIYLFVCFYSSCISSS